MDLCFDLEQVEFPFLSFPKVVHQFGNERELLETGGEDGVLAKVDLVLVQLQAFGSVDEDESFLEMFLLALFLHYTKYQ